MVIVLDTGPLGMVSNPKSSPTNDACQRWLEDQVARGIRVLVPEIADYEVRRELLRAGKTTGIARLDRALALAAIAAVADAVPIIGVLIALLPATLMALTVSLAKAEIVVAAYLIYHQFESHLIGPRVYGQALGLRLSVVVISVLIGVELMGILGAVLALPVAAAIPSVIAYIQEYPERHSTEEAVYLP